MRDGKVHHTVMIGDRCLRPIQPPEGTKVEADVKEIEHA